LKLGPLPVQEATPFLLLSPDHAVRQFKAMESALPPGVGIHYSLKPNPHPALVDVSDFACSVW
jgi:diaminopimelate decarboxylase